MCRRLAAVLLAVASLAVLCCCAKDTPGKPGTQTGEWDINKIPDIIRGIKWGTRFESGDTPLARMKFWKEHGINTVFVLVHDRSGSVLLPPNEAEKEFGHMYNNADGLKSDDVLKEMVAAAKELKMTLFVGNWMFRDDPMALLHPDWLQKNAEGDTSSGVYGSYDLLSPSSPYMTEEVYPFYKRIVEEYGIKNIFLQEMWYSGIDYNDYNVDAFFKHKYKGNLPEPREELAKKLKTDAGLKAEMEDFQYQNLKDVVAEFESIVGQGGTVAWHEPGVRKYLRDDPAFSSEHWFGTMSLYPDEAIFAKRDNYKTEMDPFLSFNSLTSYAKMLGNEKRFLEYYAFYEMARIERPIEKQDIYSLHFAARAAGFAHFCMEADAHFHFANLENPVVWDALRDVNTTISTHFEKAVYQGTQIKDEVAVTGNGYGGWWKKSDGCSIVLLGCKTGKEGLSYTLSGSSATDENGKAVPLSGTLEPGVMKMFIVSK